MSKLTNFDKKTSDIARAAINEALAALEASHGIKVKLGNGRFTATTLRFPSIEFAIIGHDGQVFNKESTDFTAFSHNWGVDAKFHNATVSIGGRAMKLIGVTARRPKFPFIGETPDGRRWKLTSHSVRAAVATAKLAVKTPDVGSRVYARWDDGKFYPAKYLRPVMGDAGADSGSFRVRWDDDDTLFNSREIRPITE